MFSSIETILIKREPHDNIRGSNKPEQISKIDDTGAVSPPNVAVTVY